MMQLFKNALIFDLCTIVDFQKKKSVKVNTVRLPRFIDLISGIGVNPKVEFSAGYTKKHLLPSIMCPPGCYRVN
jgi:hypothetical protein